MGRSPNASSATAIAVLLRLVRFRLGRTETQLAAVGVRLDCVRAILRGARYTGACLDGRQIHQPVARREQHEKSAITVVASSPPRTFASTQYQLAILVADLPFPIPAALDHDHISHVNPTPSEVIYSRFNRRQTHFLSSGRHAGDLTCSIEGASFRAASFTGPYRRDRRYRANPANVRATARYTSRRNGTTRSATRSSRSQRQLSNSAGWPLRGVSGSISSSRPV